MSTDAHRLNIGMVGYGFMGAAHSQGWRVAPRFFELPMQPSMTALAGRSADELGRRADVLGFSSTETDWRRLIERDDIDLIDICSPGSTHAEIAIAALNAGKHVLCEKPLANSVEEAQNMATAATRAADRGVFAMVGFSYRRMPAAAFARDLVAQGRLGDIRHVRAQYLQDWLVDSQIPMTWRLEQGAAGSGALGDLGAHAIDLVQFITGQSLTAVSGTTHTFVNERPLLAAGLGLSGTASSERGHVTVDDATLFTAQLTGGALGSFEATRYATGRKNALRIEINGSRGAVAFDLEDLNTLQFYDATQPSTTAGFTRILVTEPEHPYISAWWPAGHMLGYEHPFSHQVKDLVDDLAAVRQPRPSFADGLQVQRVLAAVEASAAAASVWTDVG